MAITQALCTSFKVEVMMGLHNFSSTAGDVFMIALYSSDATLNADTTAYTDTNEVTGTGYTAGGTILTNVMPTYSGTIAFTDFDDATWPSSTITARGALIYNSTNDNRAVAVLDFGTDRSSNASHFTVVFPNADSTNAVVRLI